MSPLTLTQRGQKVGPARPPHPLTSKIEPPLFSRHEPDTCTYCTTEKRNFLEALTNTANVTAACDMARLARETAYYWRSRDPDFSVAWDEAVERGLDALEDEIMRRAKDGVPEPILYQGRIVGETRRFSRVKGLAGAR